jgi:lipopolysaccharide export system protein LptA
MADSLLSRVAKYLAPAVALLAGAGITAAQEYDRAAPINLEAASSDFDYKNNTLVFRNVKVTQGPLTVEAREAHATGLDFENSKWDLKGDIRITVPDGKLAADAATVLFKNNNILNAVVHGAPATFEQALKETKQLAKGRADTIEYDVQRSTVSLSGQAWLTDGQNEIRGETLVYDIARQRVAANPGRSEPGGVQITINPKETAALRDKHKDKDKTAPTQETTPPTSDKEPPQ